MKQEKHRGGVFVNSKSNCGDYSRDEKNTYNIDLYSTEAERAIAQDELQGDTSRNQSAYSYRGGSKSGNTELRIAGVLLNFINASLKRSSECKVSFQLKDIARQLQDSKGKGISDRTVSRYLSLVLEKLQSIYGILHKLKAGAKGAYLIWTQSHQEEIGSDTVKFDEKIYSKTKRKSEVKKLLSWKNKHDKKKHSNYLKAKDLRSNKRKLPKGLAKVARNISKDIDPERHERFQLSPNQTFMTAWRLLTQGLWRKDVASTIQKAIRITDTAISDFNIDNPNKYFHGVVKNLVDKTAKPTPEDIRTERLRFWTEQKEASDKAIEGMKDFLSSEAIEATTQFYSDKIQAI